MTAQRIGQGREAAKTFLAQNPDIAAKIEAAIRAECRADRPEPGRMADEDADAEDEPRKTSTGCSFLLA